MPARIAPRVPRRIYLLEWREERHLTQEQLAKLLNVSGVTVHRWETSKASMNTTVLQTIAEALRIDLLDLYRDPKRPTPNDLLRGASEAIQNQAMDYIRFLTGKTDT